MKRFMSILLICLCFATPALSETVGQRVGAPETVVLSVETPGKNCTLDFDAQVIVPQVEKVPIFQVKIDEITEELIFAVADTLGLTDINRKPSAWESDPGELVYDNIKFYRGYRSGMKQYYAVTYFDYEDDPAAVTFSDLYSNDYRKSEYSLNGAMGVPFEGMQRKGTMTLEEARDISNQTIQSFTRGYTYSLQVEAAQMGYAQLTQAEITALNTGKKDPDSVPKVPYAFSFSYAPVFEGIPLTQQREIGDWTSKELWEQCTSEGITLSEMMASCLQLLVLDGGVQGLEWRNPMTITATLSEDTTLLSFVDVLGKGQEALRDYCIRADAVYDPSGASWATTVKEIRFGYACVQMEPGSMDLRLIPVWDFMVHQDLYRNDELERSDRAYGVSLTTISAEDGRVVQRHSYGPDGL